MFRLGFFDDLNMTRITPIRPFSENNAMRMPVHDNSAVTLVGGGVLAPEDLDMALGIAPRLIAADGGANQTMALGYRPEQVIGDLDSLDPSLRAALGRRVVHVPEQDSTDLDKCLARIEAPFVLALGFDGARLDHTLAAMTAITRHGRARVLMIAAADIVFLAPPQLRLQLAIGERVSLFPMGPVSGRSTGLHWPIDGIRFTPEALVGTSNRADDTQVTVECNRPAMLVMLERTHLHMALQALLTAQDWR